MTGWDFLRPVEQASREVVFLTMVGKIEVTIIIIWNINLWSRCGAQGTRR